MELRFLKISRWLSALAVAGMLWLPSQGFALTFDNLSTGQFQQGEGYQLGAYDLNATQPTAYNWTRKTRFSGPQQPALKWALQLGGPIASSPVIGADGTVYVGSGYNLYAVNSSGTTKWAFPTGNVVESSPAIGTDGTVYVGSFDGNLYAINPDGTQKWAFSTGMANPSFTGIRSSPAIGADGTVHVGAYDGNFYAINPDGTQKWAFTTFEGNAFLSSPAIGIDGTIYVSDWTGNFFAINADGTQKWSLITNSLGASPAIGADGTVYIASYDKNIYAINPDGTQKWAFPTGDASGYMYFNSPAIGSDGTVYVGTWASNYYAINPDGTQKWKFPTQTGYGFSSSPIIGADGTVYFIGWFDKLYAMKPDGTQDWAFQTGDYFIGSSPAIGPDSTVYVGSDDGTLFAISPVDITPPITSIALDGVAGNNGWFISDVIVSLTAADNEGGWGVSATEYSFDGVIWNTYTNPFTITTEGTSVVYYRSRDNANNIEQISQHAIQIDKTPPVTTPVMSGTMGNNGWYTSDVQLALDASDYASGTAATQYSFDYSTWYPYSSPVTVNTEGQTMVDYKSLDNAGNAESSKSLPVKIDKTMPLVNVSATPDSFKGNHQIVDVVVNGSASDAFSEISSVTITVTDEYGIYNMTVPGFGSTIQIEAWSDKNDPNGRQYTIAAVAMDGAGNQSTASTVVNIR